MTSSEVDALYEASKLDTTIIAGSQVRELIGMLRTREAKMANDQVEWERVSAMSDEELDVFLRGLGDDPAKVHAEGDRVQRWANLVNLWRGKAECWEASWNACKKSLDEAERVLQRWSVWSERHTSPAVRDVWAEVVELERLTRAIIAKAEGH